MNVIFADAAAGNKKAQTTFKDLGISITDASGNLKSSDTVFNESIARLAEMGDTAEATRLGTDLFGKGFVNLKPLLSEGKDGIEKLKSTASELGLVMSSDAVTAGDQFGDTLDTLKQSLGSAGKEVSMTFMPVFQKMADWTIENMPTIKKVFSTVFAVIGDVVGVVAKIVGTSFNFIIEGIQILFINVQKGVISIQKLWWNLSTATYTAFQNMKIAVLVGAEAMLSGIAKLTKFIPVVGDAVEKARKSLSGMIEVEKIKRDQAQYSNSLKQSTADTKLADLELKKLSITHKETSKTTKEYTETTEKKTTAQGKAKKSTEDLKKAEEKLKEQYEKNKTAIDSIGSALIDSLKKRYEQQQKLALSNKDREIDIARSTSEEKIKIYDREYVSKIKTLDEETASILLAYQSQIDGIEKLTTDEEKALKQSEQTQKITNLQKAISAAETLEEKATAEKEYNDYIKEVQREQIIETRNAQIEAIRIEMTAIQRNADEKKKQYEAEYEAKKLSEESILSATINRLNLEKTAIQNQYEELLDEDSLQAEARKLLIEKNNDEIIKLLKTYNPKWQDAGQSFGESLLLGLNSTKESIQKEVADIMALVPGFAVPASTTSGDYRVSQESIDAMNSYATVPSSTVTQPQGINITVTGNTILGEDDPTIKKLGSSIVNYLRERGINS
jgi:hypothetical protein